jgi:hypothetical protein
LIAILTVSYGTLLWLVFQSLFFSYEQKHVGMLSLAEIDLALIHVAPHIAKDKPAIIRAYKAADKGKDGFISKQEFPE